MFFQRINETQWYEFTTGIGTEHVILYKCEEDESVAKSEEQEVRKLFAMFWPEVVSKIEIKSGDTITYYIKCRITFLDGDEIVTDIPLQGIKKLDWTDVDSRCILNPGVPKASEYMANLVHLSVHDAPLEEAIIIDRLGTHIINGNAMFNTGDRLIWPDNLTEKPNVIWKPTPNIRLAIDPKFSEENSVAGMMRVVDLSPESGKILFSQVLLYIQFEAFASIGIKPRCIVFLHGFTGNKKTTYSAFHSQLHNRDEALKSPVRLNASIPAAVKLLYKKSDSVAVLDDLFPAKDNGVRRWQEKTLLEITRVIADGIEPARMRGCKIAKAPPRCGVIFTGEYYTGAGSDAARLLPVKFATPIDNDKMTACQREPLMLSTFYNYYIRWYVKNYDKICALLKEWFVKYRSVKSDIHPRLEETQFFLEAAYKLFLTFCMEKGSISSEAALNEYNAFYNQLRAIVVKQNTRVNQGLGGAPKQVDYLQVIRSLYLDRRFCLAGSPKDFEVKLHEGIIHKEHLYLRQDKLMAKIRTFEPTAEFDDVLKSLKTQYALKTGRDSNSRKIAGCRLRFYAVRLSMLQ
jgi:hypothetical protein